MIRKNRSFIRIVRYFLLLSVVANILGTQAQDDDHNIKRPKIDSVMAFSPDYLPVGSTHLNPLIYTPLEFTPIDTHIYYIHLHDPLLRSENLYQNLGIMGQAHKSIRFDYDREIGFSYLALPYPLYFKQQKDLDYYDLKTSYTRLAYTYGISQENSIRATHAQSTHGVNFVFNIQGVGNTGYFTHQNTKNISVDMLIHYEIPSGIYGFRASYIFNRLKAEENGGLFNPLDFKEHLNKQLVGYNLNLYNAQSTINTHDVLFQQYVNLQSAKEKNDNKPHYFGTLTHTFQYKNLKSKYFDTDLDSTFYRSTFYISPDTTNDSIHYHSIVNTLQWSSYKPFEKQSTKRYFLHFSGGIRHEYVETFPNRRRNDTLINRYIGNTFTLFANTEIRLFAIMDIGANLAYSFANYNKNDVNANLKIDFAINREKHHHLGLSANFYRNSPDYLYAHYHGNHQQWDTTWGKQSILKLSAYYQYQQYQLSFNYFMLDDYVVLDKDYHPTQLDKTASVLQLNLYVPFRYKGWGFDLNGCLQYSDNHYVPVPLFAGKFNLFYVFNLFQKKMNLQLGASCFYNTTFYADGYYPVLHQWYHQEFQQVGNYVYIDTYINMRVKRFCLFFRLGHAFAGLMGYDYFSTPNYPAQGRSYSVGINWRFYD